MKRQDVLMILYAILLVIELINGSFDLYRNIAPLFNHSSYFNYAEVSSRTISTEYGNDAFLRECASQSCDVLLELPDGTEIHSMEQVQGELIGNSDIWHRLEYDEVAGFVFGGLVSEITEIT